MQSKQKGVRERWKSVGVELDPERYCRTIKNILCWRNMKLEVKKKKNTSARGYDVLEHQKQVHRQTLCTDHVDWSTSTLTSHQLHTHTLNTVLFVSHVNPLKTGGERGVNHLQQTEGHRFWLYFTTANLTMYPPHGHSLLHQLLLLFSANQTADAVKAGQSAFTYTKVQFTMTGPEVNRF